MFFFARYFFPEEFRFALFSVQSYNPPKIARNEKQLIMGIVYKIGYFRAAQDERSGSDHPGRKRGRKLIKFTKKAVSFTRNRLRWGIVIAVTIILMLIVIFDSSVFSSRKTYSYLGKGSTPSGILNSDRPLIQEFTPDRRHIDYIEVRMATNLESGNVMAPQGKILFQLQEADGYVLYAKTVPISEVKDNEYLRFRIGLDLEIGKVYKIAMQAWETMGEEVPTVWVSTNVQDALFDVQYPGMNPQSHLQCNIQIRYSRMDYLAMIISILLVLLAALLAVLHFDLSDKAKELSTMAVMCLMPILMFTVTELLNNNSVFRKSPAAFLVNYIYFLLIYMLLFIAFNKFRLTTIIANSIVFVLAIFNYFKLVWRGEPIQILDVVTLQTAMNVSDNYHVELSPILIIATLLFILSILIVTKCRYQITLKRKRAAMGVCGAFLGIFLILTLLDTRKKQNASISLMEQMGVVNDVNQPYTFSQNGMIVALTINAQHIAVEVPENYSEEKVLEVEDHIEQMDIRPILPESVIRQYESQLELHKSQGKRVLKDGEKPNIICIMNESYSDMSTVGSFETNLEMHPYMDSLFQSDNVIHGDLHVSVYGGGTANSEFEFLTGNSMAFFPLGSIPYQQYIEKTTGSLPRFLDGEGYQTIAIHPYLASGWNRPYVYESMGFDEFLSIDDFSDDTEYIRSYISDRGSYRKLIELYENKDEGQPLFLFNVTMQNHGSYNSTHPNFDQDVRLVEYPEKFPETEQYLSLARQSDIAVQELIDYFRSVDEPVIICFFGDHLPSMINGFYETLLGKEVTELSGEEMQRLYMTDFFIWANYDIPECEVNRISLNYLSTLLLEMTGLDLPDYNLLLSETYNRYPIVTAMGVYDSNGRRYDTVADVPDETGILNEYNILMYNNVFETGDRRSELFDSVRYIPRKKENND